MYSPIIFQKVLPYSSLGLWTTNPALSPSSSSQSLHIITHPCISSAVLAKDRTPPGNISADWSWVKKFAVWPKHILVMLIGLGQTRQARPDASRDITWYLAWRSDTALFTVEIQIWYRGAARQGNINPHLTSIEDTNHYLSICTTDNVMRPSW